MSITNRDILDLINNTLAAYQSMRIEQIAQRYPDYPMWDFFIRRRKVSYESGADYIEVPLMGKQSRAARMVGLHAEDTTNIVDVTSRAKLPWRHMTTNYAYERREILMQRNKRKLRDLIKIRKVDAMLGLCEMIEDAFFQAPSSSSDEDTLWGLPTFCVKNATAGFNGGDPAMISGGYAEVSVTDVANWDNYTYSYTDVTDADLVEKVREAMDETGFVSPEGIENDDLRKQAREQYRIFTSKAVRREMKRVMRQNNDLLGWDLDPKSGSLSIGGTSIVGVKAIDSLDATDPIYTLDLGTVDVVFLEGDHFVETDAEPVPNQHNTLRVCVDATCNIRCIDRRRNSVGYRV